MADKEKILESWIMVEHLSEGDIDLKDRLMYKFDDLNQADYYDLFQQQLNKNKIGKNGGLVLYFDIFDFTKVVDFLRSKYKLDAPVEPINYGNKFTLALYFDRDLNFDDKKAFYTESSNILKKQKVPNETGFQAVEQDLTDNFQKIFEEANEADSSQKSEKFNEAVAKVFAKCGFKQETSRFQVVRNLETDATNLHSFFINDLEYAKGVDSEKLRQYLLGNQTGERVNLDSKKDSPSFNPNAFKKILEPKNYPLGRFPSETKYALSFMQQTAVNIATMATEADKQQIQSVNGPPGTGKTTLLKDIFAELVVEQARDIVGLGDDKAIKRNGEEISVLPDKITENSIVVASSNNGAVQNIVNELPLVENLDSKFKDIDYFRELSNSKVETEWENGKAKLNVEANEDPDKFWGLFSLEGGKSANMKQICDYLSAVYQYLKDDYIPDTQAYKDFADQYQKVHALRDKAESFARKYNQLDQLSSNYDAEKQNRQQRLDSEITNIKAAVSEAQSKQPQLEEKLRDLSDQRDELADKLKRNDLAIKAAEAKKPKKGLFSIFAPSAEEKEYEEQISSLNQEGADLNLQLADLKVEEDGLKRESKQNTRIIESSDAEIQAKQAAFAAWDADQQQSIDSLKSEISSYSGKPLDMNADYESLQLSSPWFDEEYRIEQTKLFVAALRVRKQFLFENKGNLISAKMIWEDQKKALEESPELIGYAWEWINFTIPVISSTFASFGSMFKNIKSQSLGHLFVDEAGQALPQAAVGAIFRSRHVMVVGDPSQIKPVLGLEPGILAMLGKHFKVGEKYLSESASVQTLVDSASHYGFYKDKEKTDWIGIPLWVHRRCKYPMFNISNELSYGGLMVQGNKSDGKAGWYDIKGKAKDKYVKEQGEFLKQKILQMAKENRDILDKDKPDIVYIISPFKHVASELAKELGKIGFTRSNKGKATNIGTIHTFQGKEAPIVFMVLGADKDSAGAASWAVQEPNMMNVAATRAKKEFYVIGDLSLYKGKKVADTTFAEMKKYQQKHPDLYDDNTQIEDQAEEQVVQEADKVNPKVQQNAGQANNIPACPICGKPMKLRSRRSDGAKFWGCSDFPKCRGTRNYK